MPDVPTSVYRFFDKDGTLLYVGITSSGMERFYTHSRLAPWWLMATTVQLEHHASREAALERESYLIKVEKPVWNQAGRLREDGSVPQPVVGRMLDELDPIRPRVVTKAEVREALERQIRREFKMSVPELLAQARAGTVDLQDGRLRHIIESMEGLYA